jgi:hypothetical protein
MASVCGLDSGLVNFLVRESPGPYKMVANIAVI